MLRECLEMEYSSEIGLNIYFNGSGDCVEGVRKRRTKSGKDEQEDKQMDPPPPLFPRLHINDAERRGGPRAPPRNKMALYEQLSTHSPKPPTSSVSMSPLPPNNTKTILVPSPFFNHDGTHLYETLHSYQSRGGFNLNPTLTTLEQHPKEHTSYQTSNALWHLKPTGECKMFPPHNFSNSKNSSMKKLGYEDDYCVPTSGHSHETPNCRNDQQNTHKAKVTSTRVNASGQPVTPFEKQLNQTGTTELKSRQQHQREDNKNQSLNPRKRSLVDYITRLGDPNIQSPQEYSFLKENKALIEGPLIELKSAARSNVIDSTPGLDISPDGVLGVMGQKQFWNTRRTIVHQQRVFAVQVFELHRLIKVQRLIAGSPELLLEGSFYLGKPSNKLSLTKLPYENVLEQPPLIPKPKIDYGIPKPSNDCTSESAVTKIPLPSLRNETDKRVTRQSDENPCTGIQPPASTATDAKSDNRPCTGTTQPPPFAATKANLQPLCFHPPPGNQWLVPVRSPSEGLVYKPYTAVCPPTAGLVGPVYGSCGPMALTPVAGDFFNPTYGGILSGTPLGQTFFLGPHMVPFARDESNGVDNQLSIREVNFTAPYQSSCNMLRHKSKESELQGSTASSPTERDALPLFPVAPAVQDPDQLAKTHSTEKQIRVIKVVPHNPKSATESVARIFQSIQEERRA